MTTNRAEWRRRWLNCLIEFSSLELQNNSWLEPTYAPDNWHPERSFVELMCTYFDDLLWGNDYGYFVKEGFVSHKEYKILNEWHNMLDQYESPKNNDYAVEDILTDPKWQDITKIGNKSIFLLSEVLSPEEKAILDARLNVA